MKGSITKIPEDKYFQNFDIRREGSLTNVLVLAINPSEVERPVHVGQRSRGEGGLDLPLWRGGNQALAFSRSCFHQIIDNPFNIIIISS